MKHRQTGITIVEMLLGIIVVAFTLICVFNLVVGASKASASYELTSTLSRHSRMTMDEVLYQMRGGESVPTNANIDTRTVQTSSRTAIVRMPAYHPNHPDLFLEDKWDIAVFEYDSVRKVLYETIKPAEGSSRPSRTKYVLAENVRSAEFTYYAQQSYRSLSVGIQAFALGAPLAVNAAVLFGGSTAGIQVYVDGVPAAFNHVLGTSIVTTDAPLGATVQIVYPVSPWLDGGLSLPFVSSIGFTMTVEDPTTSKGTLTLRGDSTLRNHKAPLTGLLGII